MATAKEIRDEGRLTSLEVEQKVTDDRLEKVQADLDIIKKDVAEIKTTIAKAGGVLLGFTMIGAFFGYIITQLGNIKGLFSH